MKKIAILGALLISASLSGCVAEPSPYYAGPAPYYGTTYVPAYASAEVSVGGYYPYYKAHHVYSRYNTDYWHHQSSSLQRSAPQRSAQQHAAPARSAPARGDEERR